MICTYPQYRKKSVKGLDYEYAYPCGQCMPCRVNKRRQWTARMLLESLTHASNIFITLTYDEENKPLSGSVEKKELQDFFKRLRYTTGNKYRYFACGEYGENTCRPHYHAVLFGGDLEDHEAITKAWGKGYVTLADFNPARASYVAGYTIKKLTKEDSIPGKNPEFALMSRMPGIGLNFIERIINAINKNHLEITYEEKQINGNKIKIPASVRINNKVWPLDNYIKSKLQSYLGENPNSETSQALQLNMRASVRIPEELNKIVNREQSKKRAEKHNRQSRKYL